MCALDDMVDEARKWNTQNTTGLNRTKTVAGLDRTPRKMPCWEEKTPRMDTRAGNDKVLEQDSRETIIRHDIASQPASPLDSKPV